MTPTDLMLWSVAVVVVLFCLLLVVAIMKGIAHVLFERDESEKSGPSDKPKQGFKQTRD